MTDFDLQPLDRSELGHYEVWAQDFFNDPEAVYNPYLDLTLQIDITAARRHYEMQSDGSFTAFLYFYLINSLKNHPEFFFRYIDRKWLRVVNPPLFFPIARANKKDRFYDAFIPDVFHLTWQQFAARYRAELKKSKLGPNILDNKFFVYSLFIGNLPNLQFTGMTLHTNDRISTQPFFYFGKRYWNDQRLFVSFCIKFHHSTVDPFVVDLLMQDFKSQFPDA